MEAKSEGLYANAFRLYDERLPPEPEYPCVNPPMAEDSFEWDEFSESQDIELDMDQKSFAKIENLHAPSGLVVLPSLSLSKKKTL